MAGSLALMPVNTPYPLMLHLGSTGNSPELHFGVVLPLALGGVLHTINTTECNALVILLSRTNNSTKSWTRKPEDKGIEKNVITMSMTWPTCGS